MFGALVLVSHAPAQQSLTHLEQNGLVAGLVSDVVQFIRVGLQVEQDGRQLRMGELDQTRKYIVHCKLGGRSAQAVELMRHAGLNAINVAGGITAWAQQVDTSMPTY